MTEKKQKRKVCVISSAHSASDTRVFHKQARTLAREGYEVVLVAQHKRNERVDDVQIKALPENRAFLKRLLSVPKLLVRAIQEKAAIYHFHDLELVSLGLLLKIATRSKVIYDIHEDYPKQMLAKRWKPHFVKRLLSRFIGLSERLASRVFDAVITAGDDIGSSFRTRKWVTVNNYPILEDLPESTDTANLEQCTLVYLGGISAVRGIVEVIEALSLIDRPDIRLKLIGRFSSAAFERRVRSLNGFKYVHFVGWLSQKAAYQELADADIGVYCPHPEPNYLNLRSTKIFEYMAAALPIVTANFLAWKKLVEGEGVGVTVNPLDPKAIADAVAHLLENPELRQKMGERGQQLVRGKYNWEMEAEKLLAVYNELLERDG